MLIQNAIYITTQDRYIQSTYTHDFVQYTHTDDRWIAIDGGLDYSKMVGHFDLLKEGIVRNVVLDEKSTHSEIYENLLWGTRGKKGDKPLEYRAIKSFKRSHLRAIKKNCAYYMSAVHLDTVKYWLKKKYNE